MKRNSQELPARKKKEGVRFTREGPQSGSPPGIRDREEAEAGLHRAVPLCLH
jgi:hypothetical protein